MSAGYLRRCAGKERHPDRDSAKDHRRSLVTAGKANKSNTQVYRCDQCLGWHVGRSGPPIRKGRKR